MMVELVKREMEIKKARDELNYARMIGGFRYKQAKAHYERLIRKKKITQKGNKTWKRTNTSYK